MADKIHLRGMASFTGGIACIILSQFSCSLPQEHQWIRMEIKQLRRERDSIARLPVGDSLMVPAPYFMEYRRPLRPELLEWNIHPQLPAGGLEQERLE